jgi:hypothetical protein
MLTKSTLYSVFSGLSVLCVTPCLALEAEGVKDALGQLPAPIPSIEDPSFDGMFAEIGKFVGKEVEKAHKKEVEEAKKAEVNNAKPKEPKGPRFQHAKIHIGVTNAKLVLRPAAQIPEEFRIGPFRGDEGRGTIEDVVVRLSSARIDHAEADSEKDLRGLAVRVIDPQTKDVYDLLATNAAVHHLKNVRRFVPFSRFTQALHEANMSVGEMISGSTAKEAAERMHETEAPAPPEGEATFREKIAGLKDKILSDLKSAGKTAAKAHLIEQARERFVKDVEGVLTLEESLRRSPKGDYYQISLRWPIKQPRR